MNRAAVFVLLMWLSPLMVLAEPGLLAQYNDGRTTIQTAVLNPAFTLKENESVHPQIGAKFTAKYEGSIKILRRATYAFDVAGAGLMVDGKVVNGPVDLEPGEHAIAITFQ